MKIDVPWWILGSLASSFASAALGSMATRIGGDWFSREGLREIVRLAEPVSPFDRPSMLAPLFGLAAALLGLVLSGVAVSALSTLLASLLGLAFLLTRVYGITLEVGAVYR